MGLSRAYALSFRIGCRMHGLIDVGWHAEGHSVVESAGNQGESWSLRARTRNLQSDAKRCKASLRLAKRRDVLNCIEAQEFFGMSGCLETDCLDSSPRHEHDASLARLVGK